MNYYTLEQLLGSRTKIAVLRVLARVSVPLSIRQVARQADVSHVAAAAALDELVGLGLVGAAQAGRSRVHWLERRNLLTRQLIEPLFTAEDTLDDLILVRLREALAGVYSAVLYGSRARGDDSPGSDYDVLVVQPDQSSLDALMIDLQRTESALAIELGAPVSVLGYTLSQARELSERGGNFMAGVFEDGVVLAGVHPREWGRGEVEEDQRSRRD